MFPLPSKYCLGLQRLLTPMSRLFMPVEENYMQHIYVIDKKKDGSVEKKKLYGVHYVPLTDAPE